MSIKVIGAGFGRTGTLSLKAALETLGFEKCYHMTELLDNPEQVHFWEAAERGEPIDWNRLFQGYQATVDFPGYRHYQTMLRHYPDAKVILSVRDPASWYESTRETIYSAGPGPLGMFLMALKLPFSPRLRKLVRVFKLADQAVWKREFQGRFEDRDFAIEVYHRHIEAVKGQVPAGQLLVFDVREGWEPLCRFLEVPVPEGRPFPRLNDREAFKQAAKKVGRAK